MNEYEYEFVQDSKEKKNIGRNIKYKNGTGKGPLKFPSDYLTKKEKKALNGPVISYDMGKPMNYKDFKALPRDIQRVYFTGMIDKYHPTDARLAHFWGVSCDTIRLLRMDLKITAAPIKGKFDEAAWKEWILSMDPKENVIDINPISYEDFKKLNKDTQKTYLQKMVNMFHPSNYKIAEMWGISYATARTIRRDLNVSRELPRTTSPDFDKDAWYGWISGNKTLYDDMINRTDKSITEYDLDKPISFDIFKSMDRETQRKYIESLKSEFDVSLAALSKHWGITPQALSNRYKELGISTKHKSGVKSFDYEKWFSWISGNNLSKESNPAEEVVNNIPEEPVKEIDIPKEKPVVENPIASEFKVVRELGKGNAIMHDVDILHGKINYEYNVVAAMWEHYLDNRDEILSSKDVMIMLTMAKMADLAYGSTSKDDWKELAVYATLISETI